MPKPTLNAIRKKPMVVILNAYLTSNLNEEPERDFEWFETREGMDDYFTEATEWNEQDFTDNGDLSHMTVEIVDTSSLQIGRIHIIPDSPEMGALRDKVMADPSLLIAPAPKKGETTASKKKVTKPKIKARGRSDAAKALSGEEATEAKPTTPKKKVKKTKVEVKSGPRGVPEGAGRAKVLKERLAAKKASQPKADDAPAAAASE